MEATYNLSFIALEKIGLNPFNPRHTIRHDNLGDFDQSIAKEGLLEPIMVRRVEERYQIIDGHRRFGAFWRLREQAKDDATRERFASIPARIRENVQDVEMLRLSLVKNLQRNDLTALEIADGLINLRKMSPATGSVRNLAELAGLGVATVDRYLDLATAPAFIREALEQPPPDRDAVDPIPSLAVGAALELVRCYNGLSQIPGIPNAAQFAETKVSALLRKVRDGAWSIPRLKTYVDGLLSGKLANDSKRKTPGKPRVAKPSAPEAFGSVKDRWSELLARAETFSSGLGWYVALVLHFIVTLFSSLGSKPIAWIQERLKQTASHPVKTGFTTETSKLPEGETDSAANRDGASKKAA
jgi:ParB/RepB/Spo0J family partition protein